jgi:hypothetical protein
MDIMKKKGSAPKPKIPSDIMKTYFVGSLELVKASVRAKVKNKSKQKQSKKQKMLGSTSGVPTWPNVYVFQGKDFINGGMMIKSVTTFIKK